MNLALRWEAVLMKPTGLQLERTEGVPHIATVTISEVSREDGGFSLPAPSLFPVTVFHPHLPWLPLIPES
jgi:hypothetical protein